MEKKQTIYLAGKITGDPFYKANFRHAAATLVERMPGAVVLSPAILPSEGFSYDAYMRMSTAMLKECDCVCFLPSWEKSAGARYESDLSAFMGKAAIFYDEWVKRPVEQQPNRVYTKAELRELQEGTEVWVEMLTGCLAGSHNATCAEVIQSSNGRMLRTMYGLECCAIRNGLPYNQRKSSTGDWRAWHHEPTPEEIVTTPWGDEV